MAPPRRRSAVAERKGAILVAPRRKRQWRDGWPVEVTRVVSHRWAGLIQSEVEGEGKTRNAADFLGRLAGQWRRRRPPARVDSAAAGRTSGCRRSPGWEHGRPIGGAQRAGAACASDSPCSHPCQHDEMKGYSTGHCHNAVKFITVLSARDPSVQNGTRRTLTGSTDVSNNLRRRATTHMNSTNAGSRHRIASHYKPPIGGAILRYTFITPPRSRRRCWVLPLGSERQPNARFWPVERQ